MAKKLKVSDIPTLLASQEAFASNERNYNCFWHSFPYFCRNSNTARIRLSVTLEHYFTTSMALPAHVQLLCPRLCLGSMRHRQSTPKYDASDAAIDTRETVAMRLSVMSTAPPTLHDPHTLLIVRHAPFCLVWSGTRLQIQRLSTSRSVLTKWTPYRHRAILN